MILFWKLSCMFNVIIYYWNSISSLICFWVTWDHESIYEKDLVQHLWDWILPADMPYKCIMYISKQDAAGNKKFVLLFFCCLGYHQILNKSINKSNQRGLENEKEFPFLALLYFPDSGRFKKGVASAISQWLFDYNNIFFSYDIETLFPCCIVCGQKRVLIF